MKLLIVDDNPGVVLSLYNLLGGAYTVDTAQSGSTALRRISDNVYDVILLDLDLGDMNGQEVCERARSSGIMTPILIISGELSPKIKAKLLDSGADDYITKPFNKLELEARLRVLTRAHHKKGQGPCKFIIDSLEIDTNNHTVHRSGKLIHLRPKEFTLLECLMKNTGKTVSREMLASHAWEDDFSLVYNTVHVHISQLRRKINEPSQPPIIKTVHGFGYKIDASKLVAK